MIDWVQQLADWWVVSTEETINNQYFYSSNVSEGFSYVKGLPVMMKQQETIINFTDPLHSTRL